MKRRRLLATLGLSTASLGGCTGVLRRSETSAAGDGATLSDYGCPPYAPEEAGVVCSHTVDTESAAVSLRPSTTEAESAKSVELTLHNDSETALEFNPSSWRVFERRDGEWTRLEPTVSGDGKVTVDPDTTHAWTFAEVVDYVDESATLTPGAYVAEISVPDPQGSDRVRLVAVFRLV
ncbi:hypothetical protein ACFQJD_03885 [Haloplanus sp. GCM10025708]|uniref:hypothetical protein n=1 Tax=Haloferacaceae TaxID=1644056 RepID=UPI00360C17C8